MRCSFSGKIRHIAMSYRQITSEERIVISTLRKQEFSIPEIADHLGRDRTSIWREVRRNSCNDGAYRPSKAITRTATRRSVSRRNQQFSPSDWVLIEGYIKRQWSPEQISGRLKLDGVLEISHETIYRHIWRDKAEGGQLYIHLRHGLKRRRKRYGSNDSRGRMAGKRCISERPECIEKREIHGHWEIDTVMGKGSLDCIVTLVERATGITRIGKLSDRTTASLNQRTCYLISKDPDSFETITADNGTEFHQFSKIEEKTGVVFYFARPYHSWERGTNENTNGLIRQYLPKGTSMADLTQRECTLIESILNDRPRKRYGFKTPMEQKLCRLATVALQT